MNLRKKGFDLILKVDTSVEVNKNFKKRYSLFNFLEGLYLFLRDMLEFNCRQLTDGPVATVVLTASDVLSVVVK